MTNLVTEVRVTVVVPHLDDAAVTASMDGCGEVAAAEGDVVDWSVSADLGAGELEFWLLLDYAQVAAGEQRGEEIAARCAFAGTVTARSGALVAA